MLTLDPTDPHDLIDWMLPPSKSHMIRWLALAAQAEGETVLSFGGEPGEDILSMAECLRQLGVGTGSYTHLRAHETREEFVCRFPVEKKKRNMTIVFV